LATHRASFCDLTLDELLAARPPGSAEHLLGQLQRVTRWVYNAQVGRKVPELGKERKAFVEERLDLRLPTIVERNRSDDGSTKLLLRLDDGATVEAVHMPRAVKNARVTLCISSQVGCAMGCTFCHTASMGLIRSLRVDEIVGQVFAALLELGPDDPGRVSIVFMGMGEPLHPSAIDQVTRAIEILCGEHGLGLSPMRITVSTSGLVPGIVALAKAKKRPCLALSLNATTDEARSRIMPITKRHNLEELRQALLVFPRRPHEKIVLEYVLLAGVNDTREDAERIAQFATGYRNVVNVIPWNAYPTGEFSRPDDDVALNFARLLTELGCLVTVRRSRGRDVSGACGQLATESKRRRLSVVRAT
jgi:23S rRNA (adenine2503-C2)-methyltransferase